MAKKTRKPVTRKTRAGALAVRRGRPTLYTKEVLEGMLAKIRSKGQGLKSILAQYYRKADYVSVVNAMRREGLSVRRTLQSLARK